MLKKKYVCKTTLCTMDCKKAIYEIKCPCKGMKHATDGIWLRNASHYDEVKCNFLLANHLGETYTLFIYTILLSTKTT